MRVVLFLLKCLVGFFATIGFLGVVLAIGLGLAWKDSGSFETASEEVPETAVLTLDLGVGLIERRPDNFLSLASLQDTLVLREALEALQRAGEDSRVKGLLLRVGWGDPGLAQIQELRDALMEFRASGKFILAFAESFGEGGDGTLHYYLASAGEVWLQPSGDLDLTGFALEQPYLRDALDRIGVLPQLGQREEYKGAMNTFTHNALPAPVRENLQRMVDSWFAQLVAGIAQSRGLAPGDVKTAIDRGPYLADDALELGLIDELGYWDQVGDAVTERAGDESDYMALMDYHGATSAEPAEDAAVVALVYGLGPVTLASGQNDPVFGDVSMGADDVSSALSDAIDDPDVQAIVFRVDSPGGSYVASDVIWREVQRAREANMPVIVSMGNVAASGGYFVAAPAAKIVAQPGTITGSIGVVGGKMALPELWKNLSVTWDGVQAGENAAIWSANRPFSNADWDRLNDHLDRTYTDFTGKVAQGRGMAPEKVLKAAKGQVWTGEDALEQGLVDALGGYRTAFALARDAAELAPDAAIAVRPFPEEKDTFEQLLEDVLAGDIQSPGLRSLTRNLAQLIRLAAPFVEAVESVTADPRSRTLRAPDLRRVN